MGFEIIPENEQVSRLQKLRDEYQELGGRYARLCAFQSKLESGDIQPPPGATWSLLERQRRAMADYLAILGERISIVEKQVG